MHLGSHTAVAAVMATSAAAFALPFDTPSTWNGSWFNDTFMSTGAMTVSFALEGGDLRVDSDVDGFVFGGPDPDPTSVLMAGDGSGNFSYFASAPEGDVMATLNADGTLTSTIANINGGFDPGSGLFGLDLFELTGTFTADTFTGTYVIYQDDQSSTPFATGRVDLTLVPAPGTVSLAAVGLLAMGARRRG